MGDPHDRSRPSCSFPVVTKVCSTCTNIRDPLVCLHGEHVRWGDELRPYTSTAVAAEDAEEEPEQKNSSSNIRRQQATMLQARRSAGLGPAVVPR